MPVKRRNAKRRINAEREYEVWAVVLSSGYDFFRELPELGLSDIGQGLVSADLAQEAWHRLGARHLAEHGEGWAFRQFGPPDSDNDNHEGTTQ